ncbi:MAG: ribonuclease J [Deltaproteobacteria bacterium]|nr:ribonuclease J [Deltaproteobacteria bacterium]
MNQAECGDGDIARDEGTVSLRIIPLGGCGEVGLNATLLVLGGRAILVDCGMLLGASTELGIERVVPGFEPIFEAGLRLDGVVLTHGHQDHVGALPALLAERDAPVFGTPLTMALARARFEPRDGATSSAAPEARRQASLRFFDVNYNEPTRIGPFTVEWVRVTHSVPESAALFIQCAAGRVLHSGDFRIDPTPIDGQTTDLARLREVGDLGVDLLLSDSTNAEREGRGASEAEVRTEIERLVLETEGRVVVSCIASHLHRMQSILDAAKRAGRRVCLLGRGMREIYELGVERRLLRVDSSLLIDEARAPMLRRGELLILATGAQGERQGALTRVATANDVGFRCRAGDRLILSTRVIPGNERAVRKLVNAFVRQGVDVVSDKMAMVHCSGHACAEEERDLLTLVRPRYFVPVHGERTMLARHADIARSSGVAPENVFVVEDGDSLVLTNGTLILGPPVQVSRRPIDATGRVLDWGDVHARSRVGRAGLVACSLVLDGKTQRLVAPPALTFRGIAPTPRVVADTVRRLCEVFESYAVDASSSSSSSASVAARAEILEALAERTLRSALKRELRPMPETVVHILELGVEVGAGHSRSRA